MDLNELKLAAIDIAKESVCDDKDCSEYIFNKALEDMSRSIDRVSELIKYSKERVLKESEQQNL